MSSSRGSGRSQLAVEETVWASETEGAEEVLAEFADETALTTEPVRMVTSEQPTAPLRTLRVLSPHTPMREVVRTMIIGCLSALALGASFAIGFGYLGSDLSSGPTRARTRSSPVVVPPTAASRPAMRAQSSATPAASSSTASSAAPDRSASSPAAEGRESSARADRRAPSTREISTPRAGVAVDPGPAVGAPLRKVPPPDEAPPDAFAAPESGSNETVLIAKPMLSAESAVIPEPVAPAPPSPGSVPGSRSPAEDESMVPRSSSHQADFNAVREAIGRYQAAYSRKDIGAMALVWPSIDVAGVARAFENVDRQALTFSDCRVTTVGKFATAVCPGQVRYVGRVGGRRMQERHGTWTIALERNGDAWQFTRLNVR